MRGVASLVCCVALLLSACGGGSGDTVRVDGNAPPADTTALTANITPASQPALPANTSVVVQFSAPVATSSLQLSGTLLALNPVTSWSAGNDTLTLAPPAGGWPRGQNGTLSVLATSAAGASMASPATASFVVPLQLSSGQPAFAAIGQADLNSGTGAATPTASTVRSPQGNVAFAPDGRMFIGDWVHARILGYPAVPAANNAAADIVLGQPNFTTANFVAASQGSVASPMQISISGGRMAAVDFGNSRVLIWNTVPTASGALPDVVLGQADFTVSGTACAAGRMNFPESVVITPDGKLIVADSANHRVLVWRSVPAANGTAPDLVLGQSVFNRCRRNDDNQDNTADAAPSARTLWQPTGLWSDGQRLVVLDTFNNRALVWNTFPASSFQAADLVLGQGSFTRGMRNDDDQDGTADAAPTARTFFTPYDGVDFNGVQLAIADSGNHRVLVWNAFPTSNFQPADAVLGQANFTSNAAGTSATSMNMPSGVTFRFDKLLVSDRFNNRVLILQSP